MTPAKRRLGTALAMLGTGISLAAGCGRSALLKENVDASQPEDTRHIADAAAPDLAEARRDADARRLDDAASADLAEVRRDADARRPDDVAVADLAERRRDADAGRDLASAEIPSADSSCVPGPHDPRSLALLDDLGSVFGIASFGDRLVVGGLIAQSTDVLPRGRLLSISVEHGERTNYDPEDGIPKDLQAAGLAVVYKPGVPQAYPDDWRFNFTRVVRWDPVTDERLELAQPPSFALADALPLATNAKGDVFWIAVGSGESAIAWWDPKTRKTSLSISAPSIVHVLADEANLYWKGSDETGHVTLTSTPIAGGAKSILYRSSSTSWTGTPEMVGLDDVSLYYKYSDEPEVGIMAMPKQGGSGQTVVPAATPSLPLCIDETHVYWAEEADKNSIRRAAKADGRVELVWSAPDRWIHAMTSDACNVYWIAANPFEVFYRGK